MRFALAPAFVPAMTAGLLMLAGPTALAHGGHGATPSFEEALAAAHSAGKPLVIELSAVW